MLTKAVLAVRVLTCAGEFEPGGPVQLNIVALPVAKVTEKFCPRLKKTLLPPVIALSVMGASAPPFKPFEQKIEDENPSLFPPKNW